MYVIYNRGYSYLKMFPNGNIVDIKIFAQNTVEILVPKGATAAKNRALLEKFDFYLRFVSSVFVKLVIYEL